MASDEPVANICEDKENESHLSYFPGLEIRVRRFCEHIRKHDTSNTIQQKCGSSDGEKRPLVKEDSVSMGFDSIQPAKGEECCICLQSLEAEGELNGKVSRCCVSTRCGHWYHPTCISDAFTRVPSHSCPSKWHHHCTMTRILLLLFVVASIHRYKCGNSKNPLILACRHLSLLLKMLAWMFHRNAHEYHLESCPANLSWTIFVLATHICSSMSVSRRTQCAALQYWRPFQLAETGNWFALRG